LFDKFVSFLFDFKKFILGLGFLHTSGLTFLLYFFGNLQGLLKVPVSLLFKTLHVLVVPHFAHLVKPVYLAIVDSYLAEIAGALLGLLFAADATAGARAHIAMVLTL
jgi:hypothetical protein